MGALIHLFRRSRLPILLVPAAAWVAWLLTLPPRPAAWIVFLSGLPIVALGSWLAHDRESEPWPAWLRRTLDGHALAIVLLVALGVQFEDAHGITTDGVIYFSQLRSVIFDRDLNVAAEFVYLGQPPRPYHVVPIGPTFVWLPLYLLVAGADAVGRGLGWWTAPADPAALGLTLPYVRAALVSSFAIGALGLVVLHRLLRAEFSAAVSLATTLLVFAATPLVWYMVYEPSMTHAASFGFVSLFVAAAVRWTSPAITPARAVMLGALLGAAFLSRPQEALFALVPAALLVASPDPMRPRLTAASRLAAWAFVGALPSLALQAIHSSILLSRERFSLVGAGGYLDPFSSRWDDTLWSSWHGFLAWSPVAYIAVAGTIAYLLVRARWAAITLVVLFLMAWVNGSTADWAAGWSFGGRRFTSCLVLLAPGLALVVQTLIRRPMIPIALLAAAAITWNQLLMQQFATGLIESGEDVTFAQIVRQQAALATRPPFFYPFAFPANAWFAWRTGLSIDQYDLLSPEPLRPAIDLPFDAGASRFLIAGWGPRAADQWGDLRWMEEARAEVILPLRLADDSPATLEIDARTRLLDPPTAVLVAVSIDGRPAGTLTADARERSRATMAVPAARISGFIRLVLTKDGEAPPVAIYRIAIAPRPR